MEKGGSPEKILSVVALQSKLRGHGGMADRLLIRGGIANCPALLGKNAEGAPRPVQREPPYQAHDYSIDGRVRVPAEFALFGSLRNGEKWRLAEPKTAPKPKLQLGR
jgi:hypothetical protein